MQTESRFANIVLAAVPLLITPGLFFALAESWLDPGGGEKDILIAFPYALWALIFFVVALILIVRGWPFGRWVRVGSGSREPGRFAQRHRCRTGHSCRLYPGRNNVNHSHVAAVVVA